MSDQQELEGYLDTYREMLGFVPPRVQARFDKLGTENPELLLAQERVRGLVLDNPTLDEKTKLDSSRFGGHRHSSAGS